MPSFFNSQTPRFSTAIIIRVLIRNFKSSYGSCVMEAGGPARHDNRKSNVGKFSLPDCAKESAATRDFPFRFGRVRISCNGHLFCHGNKYIIARSRTSFFFWGGGNYTWTYNCIFINDEGNHRLWKTFVRQMTKCDISEIWVLTKVTLC